MFKHNEINFEILEKRAYNLRWAAVPKDVIPLTAADPDFPSAPEIADAICTFSKEKYFCYGHPEGMPEFKESVARFFQEKRKVPVSPNYTLPVDSAAFGIFLICKTFLKPLDEAIIFDPVDFLFRYSVEAVGANAIAFAIPPSNTKVDFERLEKLISKKTKMICLCNPLNPTGKVFTREELLQLGNIACKHNLVILSDEIWSDIVFLPNIFTSIASLNEEIRDRTITVTGFSKSYGLAGLRIGAIMAHNQFNFTKILNASLHNSTIHGANVLSQVAALTALNKCEYWLQNFLKHLSLMQEFLTLELNEIPNFKCIAPQGCYVAFVNIKATNKTSQQMQEFLFNNAKVAVVPGLKKWFGDGAEGYIRLSFATSEEILKEAVFRIKKELL
jgi:aspartate/methionine/tyrosine aminotransferase